MYLRTPALPLAAARHPRAQRLQRLAVLLRRSLRPRLPGPGRLGWLLGYRSAVSGRADQDAAERAADQLMEALLGDDVLAIEQERWQAMAISPSPHGRAIRAQAIRL